MFRNRVITWLIISILMVTLAGIIYIIINPKKEKDRAFINVGWWNIRDFSTSSRDEDEISQIADIIEADILAIGELNDTQVLELLTNKMGPAWEWSATGRKVGNSPWSAEYYGFIWNEEKLTLMDSVYIYSDPDNHFDREPAWATFQTLDKNFDFTVIAVHITWGDKVSARKAEVMKMKKVWYDVQKITTMDNDLIIVGDFNRNKNDTSFDSLLSIHGMIRANENTGPTHISSNTTYDQIFISTSFTKEWSGEAVTVRFDETNFNSDEQARLVASDHRPVWIKLYIPDKDDD